MLIHNLESAKNRLKISKTILGKVMKVKELDFLIFIIIFTPDFKITQIID